MTAQLMMTMLAVALMLGGCAKQETTMPSPTPLAAAEARIADALREVVNSSGSPFAIIEHEPSGKFVQFAGSAQESLLLDLPFQPLAPDEKSRAQALFSELGGESGEYGFQLMLDRDPDKAARAALRVLREVYRLPDDAQLSIHVEG